MEISHQAGAKTSNDDLDYSGMPIKVRASMALFKNLAQTLQKQQFCDLVFELTGSIKFHTHRLVFALWSPVMMNMLNQSSCRVERILVKTGLQEAFKQLIHFLYTGTFEGNFIDIDGVLLLASTFQIPLIRSLCEKHLQQTVTVENVIGLFHISVRYQLASLEKQCVEHIRQHLPDVAQQSELKDLNPEQFNTFLASQHVSQLNPEMKLFLIISWLTEQVADRQHFLVLLLRHIDWSTVAQDFLLEISQTENFFTSHPSSLYLLLQTLHSASISLGPYTDRFEELREEHNEILNNVVLSSVHIGQGRPEIFTPLSLTVISIPKENEKDKVASSKKSSDGVIKNNGNNNNSKSAKFKSEPNEADSNSYENNVVSKNGGENSKKVSKSLSNKDSKERGSVQTLSAAGSSNQGRNKVSTLPITSEIGSSLRRKTLRPRKVVSNSSSVSILSSNSNNNNNRSVSTRRSAALQRAIENGRLGKGPSSSSLVEEEIDTPLWNSGSFIKEEQSDPLFVEDEVDEDKEEEEEEEDIDIPSKRAKKGRPKLGMNKNKVKMGRPWKGYERNKLSCPQCEYITRHSHLLDKHIRQVHESKRIIKCPVCEFQCNWSKKLYQHMRTDHYNNAGPPFLCDIQECSYSCEKMNKLVEHRRSHTGDRPFMCDECKMSFRSKSNLYAHLKCHNDLREHECQICQQRFKMKITLKQHLVVHYDSRPYLCDLCGFSTKYQAHLKAHRRTHSGDVFPCTFPDCTYSTPKKSTLQAHMRSHLGIRQHICEICNKAFIEKSHLVRHKRIHSEEKQHKCTKCDYASHRQDKLREHMQKHERLANRIKDREENGNSVDNNTSGTLPEPKKRRRRKKEDSKNAEPSSLQPIETDGSVIQSTSARVESASESATPLSYHTSPPHNISSLPGTVVEEGNHPLSSSDVNIGMDRVEISTGITPGGVVIEGRSHFVPPHNSVTSNNNHHPDANPPMQHISSLKQEKDWNELELMTRMGFTTVMGDGQTANRQAVEESNNSAPSNIGGGAPPSVNNNNSNSNNGNGLTEFTDIFRGLEASPSSSSGSGALLHPGISLHQLPTDSHSSSSGSSNRISVIPLGNDGGVARGGNNSYPAPLPLSHPPPRSVNVIVTSSFPGMLSATTTNSNLQSQRGTVKPSSDQPHPLIMVPNMSSSTITHSPHTYHQQQQQHHRHHHTHQNQNPHQQQHHHSDEEQIHYHHHHHHRPQQHLSSTSPSSSLSLSQQHQQMLQQQHGNQSSQSSSNFPPYPGYQY